MSEGEAKAWLLLIVFGGIVGGILVQEAICRWADRARRGGGK